MGLLAVLARKLILEQIACRRTAKVEKEPPHRRETPSGRDIAAVRFARADVIVHELLHFSVPNHGKLWKSLMRAHLGDYERLESRLRRAAGVHPVGQGKSQ
jgi:hypothetical protein